MLWASDEAAWIGDAGTFVRFARAAPSPFLSLLNPQNTAWAILISLHVTGFVCDTAINKNKFSN